MDLSDVATPYDFRTTFGVSGARFRLRHAADAFDPVAWRAPGYPRTRRAPANDVPDLAPRATPRWRIVCAGCVTAALMGAVLGAALAI